ncbi:MAG TPA: hypothetical protein VJ521_10205 [Acidobacteriota bacterium]|nr:hypothetical protein [Acidobacteriota bacterium]
MAQENPVTKFLPIVLGNTTSPSVDGGTLPSLSGALKQIFPGSSAKTLFEKHKQAIDFLKQKGVDCKPVTKASFDRDFRAAMDRTRKHVFASPINSAFIALRRTVTKKSPSLGAVQMQPETKAAIEYLTRFKR